MIDGRPDQKDQPHNVDLAAHKIATPTTQITATLVEEADQDRKNMLAEAAIEHVTHGTINKMLFDYDDLSERLMQHEEMMRMIIDTFNGEVPTDLQGLQEAVDQLELPIIASLAHKIKGASRNVGSEAMATSAEIMEKSAKAGDTSPMLEQMAKLWRAYQGFKQQVTEVHQL